MSRLVQFFALLIMLCCVVGSVLSQDKSPTAEEKREAEKAWESLIKAKGGREKLHSITNILYSRPDYGNLTQLYVFPNSKWEYGVDRYPMAPKGERTLAIFDGSTFTWYSLDLFGIAAQSKRTPESANSMAALDQLPLLLETKWFKPEPQRVFQEKDGKRQLNVIKTTIAGLRLDFVYDPNDLMIFEVRDLYDDGSIFRKDRFFEYTEIDGIKMPQKSSTGVDDTKFRGLRRPFEAKFMFNVNYVPDLFTRPEPAYSPDAWGRRSIPSVRLP